MNNRISKNKRVLFATLLIALALAATAVPAARANSHATRAPVNVAGDEYWSSLGNPMLSIIYALARDSSGILYAGGAPSSPYISQWNGTTWSAVGGGMGGAFFDDKSVHALATDASGNLFAGGGFTTAGGVAANRIAKWNGSAWSPLGSGIGGSGTTVYALALEGSGTPSPSDSERQSQSRSTDSGQVLYAGGYFTTAGGVSAICVAKWDGTNWSPLGNGTDGAVKALLHDGSGTLYAGGEFAKAGGLSAKGIAKWNGASWSALGTGINGYVYALALDTSRQYLYAGGLFNTAGSASAKNIARWDLSTNTWSALGSEMLDDIVRALALDANGNLFVGGEFRTIGGTSVQHIAQWNPTTNSWSALGSGTDAWVFALLMDRVSPTPALYVGGQFAHAGGKSALAIAKWSAPFTGAFKLYLPLALR